MGLVLLGSENYEVKIDLDSCIISRGTTRILCSIPARTYRSVDPGLVARAEQITGDTFPVAIIDTAGRECVRANDAAYRCPQRHRSRICQLFAVAQRHGYRNRLSFGDYKVFIGRADRTKDSSGQYSPDIAVPAQQYAGSYYDQGGFIYAAGMVLAFNPSAFVIAEHDRDLDRISNVVRYEGEHIILYYNDRGLYEKTADHSRGGGHPILQ